MLPPIVKAQQINDGDNSLDPIKPKLGDETTFGSITAKNISEGSLSTILTQDASKKLIKKSQLESSKHFQAKFLRKKKSPI